METIDVIRKLLKENAGVDPDDVTEDATLESLNLDSIDVAELICNLEDELEIDFGNPQDINTVGDVINHIKSLQQLIGSDELALVAQWTEHLPPEQGVAGSTPVEGTIFTFLC